ncbi:MAG: hypothetical protein IMY72_14590 [Bacteroidetes bacterium]|nr:hypothetical protein [Bacteroidota bacterium]
MKNLQTLLLIFLSIIIVSCSNDKEKKTHTIIFSEKMAKVVSQLTNGNIHSKDIIQVRFVNKMVNKQELNKELENDIFDFSPSIKGRTYWKSTDVLVFEPKNPLPYRKNYDGKINLIKLSSDLKDKVNKPLKFSFSIIGREIASFKGELKLKDRNNPKLLIYQGKISFTEETEIEEVEDAISLKSGSKGHTLHWYKESNDRSFSFASENVIRTNKTNDYTFFINKDKMKLSDNFEKSFQVTPLEEMKVIKVVKNEDGRFPKVRIEFSDEFDTQQNISGLIKIEPKLDMKIQKLGNSLILDANFKFGSSYKITIENNLRSRWGTSTKTTYAKTIKFSDIKPQIEFASDGVFLPSSNKYKLQFYTSNLKRVHIEVKKVYETRLSEFLRTEKINSLNDRKTGFNGSYTNRVGVIIHNETFEIDNKKNTWLLSEINLSDIIKNNNKGLYLIRLNFNPRDMLVEINTNKFNYIGEYGQIYKPLFFSNIGLTCKKTKNNIIVFATDIITCKPLSNVKIELKKLYNDNSVISTTSTTTDSDGKAVLNCRHIYNYYIEAESDGQRSVVKFNEMQWNTSGFDVGGINEYKPGTKAFMYTERGVYRPGDEVNVSVIAKHQSNKFPSNYPLTLELQNPQGKKVYTINNKKNQGGFYNFKIQTKQSDPTGNWTARIKIGNKSFTHTVKIETIVPYRLKVKLKTKTKVISYKTDVLKFKIESKYLFGNPATNLSAEVDLEISKRDKVFPKYKNFVFKNPCIDFKIIQKKLFKGNLNEKGIKELEWRLPSFVGVPSALNLKLTGKVLEKGGRPNINWKNIPIEPYSHYVGIQPPKYSYVTTGNDAEIPTILVNTEGKPVAGKTLKYRIYRNNKYWWWQYDSSKKLRFKTDNNTVLVKEGNITSKKLHSNIKFLPIEEGNYLIEVTDASGTGHSSGIFFSAYPYGGSSGGDKNAGTLALHSDKDKYNVGDEANIQFPSPKEGIILLSIEKENKVIQHKWYYPEKDGEMNIKIPITKNMVPNAYVSISLMQPHSQTVNDRPIRMFGILPLLVEDKDTRHYFEIKTESQFRPKKPFEIEIQTISHKQTQFTIAVVDEGLLDITRFKTPNPWKYFFRKTRLNVNTYDLFSQIISANKGDVFKTFSIGGDMDYRESQEKPDKGKRRFKPVSLFKGPIMTDNNGKATVKFNMPNYVGSVRIMVIGEKGNSYARAEKTVPVKSELMILPTLPKVIGPSEKFTIPISVFAMKNNIGKVSIKVITDGSVKVDGKNIQTLNFTDKNDKDCSFNLRTIDKAGQSKVTITAKSENYSADYIVDLMVRPSSPRIYSSSDATIIPGKTQLINIPKNGVEGTNRAELTISNFPVVNFSHRLKWLIQYPYGCIEQTTSAVFPQLYLKNLLNILRQMPKKSTGILIMEYGI